MTEIDVRKEEHLRICLEEDVQARSIKTGFNDVHLIHRALPDASIDDVKTSIELFNHTLSAPIIIEGMTGGTQKAVKINAALADAAETLGIAMGVGSQRAALENAKWAYTFKIARKKAPNAFLIANLGAPQLRKYKLKTIMKAIDMIKADALAIHLNPLQEAIQPEGTPHYSELLTDLSEVASRVSIPVIVKETGAGIAFEDAVRLRETGVKGIDVGGAGGTSWAGVEACRAARLRQPFHMRLGETFWDWGIPTTVSIVEVSQSVNLKIIASGGLRSGVDIAKALSLGADAAGFAFHLLKPAVEGTVKSVLNRLIRELKISMFLVGIKTVEELRHAPLVIVGETYQWLEVRGFHPKKFVRRKRIGSKTS